MIESTGLQYRSYLVSPLLLVCLSCTTFGCRRPLTYVVALQFVAVYQAYQGCSVETDMRDGDCQLSLQKGLIISSSRFKSLIMHAVRMIPCTLIDTTYSSVVRVAHRHYIQLIRTTQHMVRHHAVH